MKVGFVATETRQERAKRTMEKYCQLCNVMLGKSEHPIPHRRCEQCGALLPPPKADRPGPGGRTQIYCTRACRDKAYYRRRHGIDDDFWVQERLDFIFERQEHYGRLAEELRAAHAEIARLRALLGADA